jgi:hypothetical protein
MIAVPTPKTKPRPKPMAILSIIITIDAPKFSRGRWRPKAAPPA